MVNRYCSCCYHMAGNPNGAANFFRSHFVPEKWELGYFKLSECMGVTLAGRCMDCRGALEEAIPIPKGLAGDDLLKAIYDTMQTAHPYDKISGHIGYYGDCEERSLFYTSRDNRSQRQRSKEFLEMFNDYDREQARVWLEKNFPPQKHTEVFGTLAAVCSAPLSAWQRKTETSVKPKPFWTMCCPVSTRLADTRR